MRKIIFILSCFLQFPFLSAQVNLDSATVDTLTISSGLTTVWSMVYGEDGWIWFTERTGRINRVNPVSKETILLAELPDVYENAAAGQETGLLGMALHPDFSDSPYVFVVWRFIPFREKKFSEQINFQKMKMAA